MPRGRPKKSASKCLDAYAVQKIVRKELSGVVEEKHAMVSGSGLAVHGGQLPTGDVSTENNFYTILPSISQDSQTDASDNTAYGTREGDEIILKDIQIKGYVHIDDNAVDGSEADNCRLGVRLMILAQKDKASDVAFKADAHMDKLLLDSTNQGPGSFEGTPLDLFRKINRNEFTVKYNKVIYLNQDFRVIPSGLTNVNAYGSTDGTLKFFSKKLTFGKRGRKLTFTDRNSISANQFGYIMVAGLVNMNNPNQAVSNSKIKLTYDSIARYTDL